MRERCRVTKSFGPLRLHPKFDSINGFRHRAHLVSVQTPYRILYGNYKRFFRLFRFWGGPRRPHPRESNHMSESCVRDLRFGSRRRSAALLSRFHDISVYSIGPRGLGGLADAHGLPPVTKNTVVAKPRKGTYVR